MDNTRAGSTVGKGRRRVEIENFSAGEFDRRLALIERKLGERGLDGLIVTGITNLPYVAGDAVGWMTNSGATLSLTAAVIGKGEARMMVRLYEAESARLLGPHWLTVVPYSGDADDPRNPPDVLAELVEGMGLGSARIGVELDIPGLTPGDLDHLKRALPNARFADASDLIVSCSVVKSEEELAVMRRAAAATEAGIRALRGTLRPGVREAELASSLFAAMIDSGSEYPIFHPFISSAARSALPHAVWSDREVQSGESVFSETSGSVLRYHAPLIRTSLIGYNDAVEAAYAVTEEALDTTLAMMRPGVTTGMVDDACRGVIKARGYGPDFRLRTGYQAGIDWTTRGSVSLMPGGTEELIEGMTFHVRPLLQFPGRFALGCSETVVVTENGCQPLGTGDHALIRA
jgi:Xaa-Pro dipeptidase